MKKAHNVYIDESAWAAGRKESLKYKDLLKNELTRHPDGSSSAYYALVAKACLLIDNPALIHDTRTDWKSAIEYCKRNKLPLSKYISTMP
jgi:hypothetical protein